MKPHGIYGTLRRSDNIIDLLAWFYRVKELWETLKLQNKTKNNLADVIDRQ